MERTNTMNAPVIKRRYCPKCNKDVNVTKHGHCPDCARYIVTGAKKG